MEGSSGFYFSLVGCGAVTTRVGKQKKMAKEDE